MEKKKHAPVLILGSSGFVGQHLEKALQAKGRAFLSVPGPSHGGPNLAHLHEVEKLFDHQTYQDVVLLSANLDPSPTCSNFERSLEIHVKALGFICEQLSHFPQTRLIHLGTSYQFGQAPLPYHEDSPFLPTSIYGLTKSLGEEVLRYYQRTSNLAFVCFRPTNLYGPLSLKRGILPFVMKKCLAHEPIEMTSGEQKKDFLYISDAIAAIELALEKREVEGAFNLSFGEQFRLREVVEMIHRMTRSRSPLLWGALPYRASEPLSMSTSSLASRERLGWKPLVNLEEGLRRTLESLN